MYVPDRYRLILIVVHYFSQEMMQSIETSFANANMIGNDPPSDHTWFASVGYVFQNDTPTTVHLIRYVVFGKI
jgi:hypothetical protein